MPTVKAAVAADATPAAARSSGKKGKQVAPPAEQLGPAEPVPVASGTPSSAMRTLRKRKAATGGQGTPSSVASGTRKRKAVTLAASMQPRPKSKRQRKPKVPGK